MGLYDNLSRDPNSLANLDQDLPNYAQSMIPIHSLPQEWLWCESWCSEETKGTAKTIDLCNNPMYKEPKLQMAKRVISGDLFKVTLGTPPTRRTRRTSNACDAPNAQHVRRARRPKRVRCISNVPSITSITTQRNC